MPSHCWVLPCCRVQALARVKADISFRHALKDSFGPTECFGLGKINKTRYININNSVSCFIIRVSCTSLWPFSCTIQDPVNSVKRGSVYGFGGSLCIHSPSTEQTKEILLTVIRCFCSVAPEFTLGNSLVLTGLQCKGKHDFFFKKHSFFFFSRGTHFPHL